MVASTISSLMPSRSILGAASLLIGSRLVARVGEGGGVDSMAMAESGAGCDRFKRLLGCESGDCDREEDVGREDEEADDRRPAPFEAAARALLVTGM